jgi:hypothetical protein
MTTMGKQRTITLTGRPPVTIDEDEWPLIARASDDDYQGNDPAKHQQASAQGQLDEYSLRVRQHADGRAVVYGTYTEGWHSEHDGLSHAGYVVIPDGNPPTIEHAIDRVGKDLGVPAQLVADCIADLPAEKL